MKRYVREFANDEQKKLADIASTYGNNNKILQRICAIEQAVKACERGLITDFEAVKLIVYAEEK